MPARSGDQRELKERGEMALDTSEEQFYLLWPAVLLLAGAAPDSLLPRASSSYHPL
jgi:hypothetical protein